MNKKIIFVFILLSMIVFGKNMDIEAAYPYEIGDYGVGTSLRLDEFKQKSLRDLEYTIKDSNRWENDYDTIDIDTLYNGRYNFQEMKEQGYKTIVLEITMNIWEKDDGYQYILFYDDTSRDTYLSGAQIEHGPGKKNSTDESYTFYAEFDISKIENNDIVVRYTATGAFSDTWYNDNVTIQIGASMDKPKTKHIWRLKWKVEGETYTISQLLIAT